MLNSQLIAAGDTDGSAIRLAELLLGHPDLLYLKGVLEDLVNLERSSTDVDDLPYLREVSSTAKRLLEQLNWTGLPLSLHGYPTARRNGEGERISPFHHAGLSDLPIWPILLTSHDDDALAPRYRIFLAETVDLLIAYVQMFSTSQHYKEWCAKRTDLHPLRTHLSTAITVSVTLRFLVHAKYSIELNEFLSEYEEHGLVDALAVVRDNEQYSLDFRVRLAAIERLLSYLNGRQPPDRSGGIIRVVTRQIVEASGCSRVAFTRQENNYTEEEDTNAEPLETTLFLISPEDLDNPPGNEGQSSPAERRRWRDPKYQLQHIARANYPLPYTRNYLQPYQLERLNGWLCNQILPVNPRRLVAGMLLLGRSLVAMQSARYAHSSSPRRPEAEIELLVDARCWRIKPEIPEVKDVDAAYILPVADSLCLPLLPEWEHILLPKDALDRCGQLIANDISLQGRGLAKLLQQVDPTLRPTLVMQWLGRALFQTGQTHNAAALLTPYGAPHLATVAHYEHPRADELVVSYKRALAEIQAALPRPSDALPPPIPSPPQAANNRIGTATASDPDALREWIKRTLHELNHMELVTTAQRCHYSNLFVRYSLLKISANCLLRGVTDPDLQIVDPRRRLVVVADKSRGSRGAMNRLVVLTRDGFTQMKYIEEHRKILRTMYGMPANIDDTSWPILTWNSNDPRARRTLRVEAATTKHICGEDFPGKLNALRKHLHTRLGEEGIPGQYLDVLCGHWHPGMEGYSQYSALNPRLLTETVSPLLDRLLNDLGFRPHRSRLK